MRLPPNTQELPLKSSEGCSKEHKKLWTKVFGFKKGDIVRVKYGKCWWEVYAYHPKEEIIKVIRFRKTRDGHYDIETLYQTFHTSDVVEVQDKETVGGTFPSQVFR